MDSRTPSLLFCPYLFILSFLLKYTDSFYGITKVCLTGLIFTENTKPTLQQPLLPSSLLPLCNHFINSFTFHGLLSFTMRTHNKTHFWHWKAFTPLVPATQRHSSFSLFPLPSLSPSLPLIEWFVVGCGDSKGAALWRSAGGMVQKERALCSAMPHTQTLLLVAWVDTHAD